MGRPDDCNCHCGSGEPPIRRYDCVGGICVQTSSGIYINDPTCGGNCSLPPQYVDYDCVGGFCVPVSGGAYRNDPTCSGNCSTPPQGSYECYLGLCVPWWNGTYSEPTCGFNCDSPPPPSGDRYHYILVNCSDENDIIYRKSNTPYWSPYNDVFLEDSKCYRMVGLDLSRSALFPLTSQETTCDYCTNNGCYFDIEACSDSGNVQKVLLIGGDIFDCSGYINKVFRIDGDPTCWRIKSISETTDVAVTFSTIYNDCAECAADCPWDCGGGSPVCPDGFTFNCETCECEANPPPPDPLGACCFKTPETSTISCESGLTESQCELGYGGNWYNGDICSEVDCGTSPPPDPPQIGACCIVNSGCFGNVTDAWCLNYGGTFYPDTPCSSTPCYSPGDCFAFQCGYPEGPYVDCPFCDEVGFDCVTCGCSSPPAGACCHTGGCSITSECECDVLGGVWYGGKTCIDPAVPCAIPE